MSKKLRPIILAGGIGKRLWPLSTESLPKQFIPIFQDFSLFDLTLQRVNNSLFKKPIIVTSEKYLKLIRDGFERTGLKPSLIVLEPESKNTFAPIITAAILSNSEVEDERFIVMPSDHYISSNKNLYKACKKSLKRNKENLLLLGVKPEYPSQEHGYITDRKDGIEFIEKPAIEIAKRLFKEKNIFWNSGIFIFGRDWILNQAREIDSLNFNTVNETIRKGKRKGDLFYLKSSIFSKVKSISFDHGFVEKCQDISMVHLDAGWTDLGSWVSLRALEENKLPSIYKDTLDTKIERPWGFFQVLLETSSTKLKLIKVLPKQKLSLQKHEFRSERWHVIKGRAKIVRDSEKFTLELGDTIDIEKCQTHSLENVEDDPLEIIEIQTGEYLGEDDIIRLEDIYGRVDLH